jgi:hypothetical protein
MAELSDVALDLADSDPALVATKRGSARVVAGISTVMRAEPIWLPNGRSVTPGAGRAAGRGGAQPGHHQRPPRHYRRYPHPHGLGRYPPGAAHESQEVQSIRPDIYLGRTVRGFYTDPGQFVTLSGLDLVRSMLESGLGPPIRYMFGLGLTAVEPGGVKAAPGNRAIGAEYWPTALAAG